MIDKKIIEWRDSLRYGKKLRINIWFSFVDSRPPSGAMKWKTNRGSSATQRILSERAVQLDAEEDSSSHPSVWRYVYALFRCPSLPCDLGPYCWICPTSKKYYKLRTHHLRALAEWVEQLIAEPRRYPRRHLVAACSRRTATSRTPAQCIS